MLDDVLNTLLIVLQAVEKLQNKKNIYVSSYG